MAIGIACARAVPVISVAILRTYLLLKLSPRSTATTCVQPGCFAPLFTFQERMIITRQRRQCSITDRGHSFDRHTVFLEAKTTAGQNFFIAACVQISKAAGEFD